MKLVCPRCGSTGSLVFEKRGEREYAYMVHWYWEGKKRKKKKCYLGPKEKYLYVTEINRILLVSPLLKPDAYVDYVRDCLSNLIRIAQAAEDDDRIIRYISSNIEQFEKLVNSLKNICTTKLGKRKDRKGGRRAGS